MVRKGQQYTLTVPFQIMLGDKLNNVDRDGFELNLPSGYSIEWAGQYEYMQRAQEKLSYVVPLTLAIIIVLLYLNFRNMIEVAMIMLTLPLAMVGSIWLMYLEGYNFSVAVGVGFIALAGVAVEIGVIMLVYLNQAYSEMLNTHFANKARIDNAIGRI